MGGLPYDRYGQLPPHVAYEVERVRAVGGPPSLWGGNMTIPEPLKQWTRDNRIAGTIARKFLREYPDPPRISDRPRYFTGYSFKGYGPWFYEMLLHLGLIEARTSRKHGGSYAVPLNFLYAWCHFADTLHPESKDEPCLSLSTLSSLPVISPTVPKAAPPGTASSPPSASP